MNSTNTRTQLIALIAGDIAVLTLFFLAGEIQHGLLEAYNPALRTLAQVAMVAPPLILLSLLSGCYTRPPFRNRRDVALFLLRSALVWLYAAPLGLVFRAWGLQAPAIAVPFINAALAFGGLALLLWRGAYALIALALNRRRLPV